jgi:diguanylate cyclase (GGDEF)-like protein
LIQIPIRISMGVAELPPEGDLDQLIRAADAALYRAKRAGRDRICS